MSATGKLNPDEKLQLGDLGPRIVKLAGGVGVVFLALTVVLGLAQGDAMRKFFHSYLVSLTYFLSIALGALFFVLIQHLTRSRWSVVVRRIAEVLTMTFPVLGVLFVIGLLAPMIAGNDSLYLWTTEAAKHDHLIHDKMPWLNAPFFAVRIVVYFVAWTLLARYFFRKSLEQDEKNDPEISERLRVVSAPGLIIYAFATGFAAFDLLMSLDPHWFSTIFGVYYFAGCAVSIMAVLALVSLFLQSRGRLEHSITVEHYHDIGKLLFAFIFFWGYIAFSQFMLIWYGDLPEETIWYKHRMFTSWKWLSLLLLFGHFCFPFVSLLTRETKRRVQILAGLAIWMLVMHFFDLYWLVMPEYDKSGFVFGLIDVTAMLGVGGIFVAAAARVGIGVSLVPTGDPRLGDSLGFENY